MSRRNNILGSIINPLSLSPSLWIDFGDASTITIGTGVSQINDKSGFGRNYTQGLSFFQPLLISGALNGRSVAEFDGINDDLILGTNGLLKNLAGATIMMVRKWNVVPTTGQVLFKIANNAFAGRAQIQGGNVANKNAVGGRTLDSDSFVRVDSAANATTNWRVQTGVFDYANTDLHQYIGDTLDGTTTSFQTATTTSNTDSTSSSIGSGNGAAYASCRIAEILVFPSVLSATNFSDMLGFFNNKWGV